MTSARFGSKLAAEHRRRNAMSRPWRAAFTHHRTRVMECLLPPIAPLANPTLPQNLVIYGAGNGNDIDLNALARWYPQVDLVDLDDDALRYAIDSVSPELKNRIRCHAPVDLCGLVDQQVWQNPPASPAEGDWKSLGVTLRTCARPEAVPQSNVTASIGVLSQIIDSIAFVVPRTTSDFLDLLLAGRDRHLEMLVEQTLPGGDVWLITDFVSSQTFPGLNTLSDEQLANHIDELVRERNFFTGINPVMLPRRFKELPSVVERIRKVDVKSPWCWQLGAKTFAVIAIHVALEG